MEKTKILVWDLPVRAFHWLLALSFAGAFLTAESERVRDIHVALGYAFLGLIAFRLVWGVVGTRYARFASFASGPRAVWAYLKSLSARRPGHYVGHNPAGGWAIFAMLALGIVTGLAGHAAYDGIGGRWTGFVHEGAANALLALVGLHVAAVAISSVLHRENLLAAMVTGRKTGVAAEAADRTRWGPAVATAAAVAALGTAAIQSGEPQRPAAAATPDAQSVQHPHARHGGHDDDS